MKRPFEEIVTEYGPSVLLVCRALLARHDADDAWSETFLSALRAYPDLPDEANVQAWLVTIAYRKAIDATRAQSRRPLPVAEPPTTVSELGIWAPADDDLWSALAALPDKQRGAVTCHHVAGLPYAQVAVVLGGSVDAARRAAHDGIKALRRSYRPTPSPSSDRSN